MLVRISNRFYNNMKNFGTVFNSILDFELTDSGDITIVYTRTYFIKDYENTNDAPTNYADLLIRVPMYFTKDSIYTMKKILVGITQNPNYKVQNETELGIKHPNCFDITIDNVKYEVPKNDPGLGELLKIIRFKDFDGVKLSSVYETEYKAITSNHPTAEELFKIEEYLKSNKDGVSTVEQYKDYLKKSYRRSLFKDPNTLHLDDNKL